MKSECPVVQDLLPLYSEKMLRDETADFVETHLKSCPACTAALESLSESTAVCDDPDERDQKAKPLKLLKRKIAKRRMLLILGSVTMTLLLVFAYWAFRPVTVEYGESDIYTKEDMDLAIEQIRIQVASWEGCKLYSISYTSDSNCEKELPHCNQLALSQGVSYSECIVFRVSFRSPIFGGGSWNPNYRYDWNWWFARVDGGEWVYIGCGI